MKRKVPPTRMELLRIRKRLALAVRGHKLLKDKLEGLIQEVTERLGELKRLRLAIDAEFPEVIQLYVKAAAICSVAAAEVAAATAYAGSVLQARDDRIMGIPVQTLQLTRSRDIRPYCLDETSPYFDLAIRRLQRLMARLVRLTELEDTIRRLADELERTRRRANALEYSVIPDLRDTRRMIEARLEEYQRSDISRLMKVKDMLLARDQAARG